jgi:hypothetical protein
MKVFYIWKNKEGVKLDEFLTFYAHACEVMRGSPYVERVQSYVVEDPEGKVDFQMIDVIEIPSWEAWEKEMQRPEHKEIHEGFMRFATDDDMFCLREVGGRRPVYNGIVLDTHV